MTPPIVRLSPIIRPYWQLLPEDTRADIERRVPAGHFLYLGPGYRAKPGTADVSLRTWDNHLVGQERGRDLAAMCHRLLGVTV